MLSDAELEAVVADARRPGRPWPAPRGISRWDRFRLAFPRWLVPRPLAIRAAELRGLAIWAARRPERDKAEAWAAGFLGSSPPDGAVTALARRICVEQSIDRMLAWRVMRDRPFDVEGIEELEAARAGGRGAVVTVAHLGLNGQILRSLAASGHPVFCVRPRSVKLIGLRGQRTWDLGRELERLGVRFVARGGLFAVLGRLLSEGELAFVAFDIKGRSEVELCGRRVLVASGVASLAWELGVPIVPAVSERRGTKLVTVICPALEPSSHASADDLRQAVADVLSERIERAPARFYPRSLPAADRDPAAVPG